MRAEFIERTLRGLEEALLYAASAEDSSAGRGFLQRIDPRAKLAGLLLLIAAAVASHRVVVTVGIFALGLSLAFASGDAVVRTIAKLWGGIFLFTGAIVFPALFVVPGASLWRLPWVGWNITAPGFHSAVQITVRTETTATLATLLVLTTRWPDLLKALRALRVPVVAVVILGMTHRYLFLLLETARHQFEGRRARLVGKLDAVQRRRLATSSAGALLTKSVQLSSEVYEAMQARGFRGEVYTLNTFQMKRLDWAVLAAFVLLAATAFWIGGK